MKSRSVQTNFLSGVIDPRAAGRIDTDAYNEGLLLGENVELNHLGGIRRRRGLRFRRRLSNVLTRVTLLTPTAPNGGTAANANDDSETTAVTTTTPVGTTNEFVLVRYDLGSEQAIVFADVLGIATASGSSTEFRIQYSDDGASWNNMSPSAAASNLELVDTTPRDYRRFAPAPARYWRVVRVGVTDLPANVTLTGFNLWLDSGVISALKLVPFEVSPTSRFLVAFTDRTATVFENGLFVNYTPTPYESADILELDAAGSEGELVVVHEDFAPRAFYEDTDDNFQSVEIEFSSIPQVDYNDSLSPTPTSDVQKITFATAYDRGDSFQIELDGARSGPITYAGDSNAEEQLATATNIAREVQKLYTVRGFAGVSCARTNTDEYTVTFAAGSANAYKLMSITTLAGTGTATVVHTTTGVPRTEDLWGPNRGYPGSVAFFQGRMYLGGPRSKRQGLLGSAVSATDIFETLEALDDEAIFVVLSGQASNNVVGLCSAQTLQIFTSGGEFRYVRPQGEPITPSDKPVNQTQNGSAKIRPVVADGVTIYVAETRKALRDFKYDYAVDAYTSLSLSSLAQHLLNDVVDVSAWNGSREDELTFVFTINGDGTVAVLNLRREAEVRAWVKWTTSGLFKAVACVRQDVYFGVVRELGDGDALCLEQADSDYYMDCAVQTTNTPASATVNDLDHLDGVECRVRADDFVLGNVTPSSGSTVLSEGAFEEIEVGIGFNPTVQPMPLNAMVPEGANFMTKRRVVKARVKVRNTLGLLCNGRVLPDRFLDVDSLDEPATPYSGVHTLEESTDWDETEDKLITFTQVDPLPMEIQAIQVDMETE
jgi:hypothetical protein